MKANTRVLRHAMEIAKIGFVCMDEDYIYAHDDHRIIRLGKELAEEFKGYRWGDHARLCKGFFDKVERENSTAMELPELKMLRNGIKELVGKKRARVAYSFDEVSAINARYLIKVVVGLKCTKAFRTGNGLEPFYFFEEDEFFRAVEVILPVRADGRKGIWTV